MDFTLAHGTANDFVVLADLDDRLVLTPALVRALCDRRRGLGADGVLRLGRPHGDAHVFMDYRNADGGAVEMCGNGVRVVAKHVLDHGLVTPPDDRLVIGTRAGDRAVTVHRGADGLVAQATVDMGPPSFDPAIIGFDPGDDPAHLDVDGGAVAITAVSMGNPHAVTLVDGVDRAPVTTLGPKIETHPRFAKGANVEFVQVLSTDAARLRVWERGIGETASCGTGICAAYAVLHQQGLVGPEGEIHVPGGTLQVRYAPQQHDGILLTGPAVEVAHGTLDPAWVAAATSEREEPR